MGKLVFAEAATLLVPFFSAVLLGCGAAGAFFFSFLLALFVGALLQHEGAISPEPLSKREGIAITAFGWLLATGIGMLPYVFGGYLGLLDGIFESISGFTGTGATVFQTLENLPESLLLWRMMTHWFGGLGIIVIFIALIPESEQSRQNMYDAETTGATRERLLPRLRNMAKVLFAIYIVFTGAAFLVYRACGLSLWDAATHAMSTIGAGGFSTYDTSAAHFASPVFEASMTFFMILAGGNFALYYRVMRKGPRVLWQNTEFRWYISILCIAAFLVTINLVFACGMQPLEALRYASFQVGSLSTTGFVSANFDTWPGFSKGILLMLMVSGGCAGGCAGGMKVTRIVILVKHACAVIHQKLSPRSVVEVRMNGAKIGRGTIGHTEMFAFLYVLFIALFALSYALADICPFDALTISISALGSVGPAFGVAGATQTYAPLPDFMKGLLCLEMLLGRLELFTILVLFSPDFWKLRGRW